MLIRNMRLPEMQESFDQVDDLSDMSGNITKSAPITLWVPLEIKQKYDRIQSETRKEYGKRLKMALIKSIDKVKIDE